MAQEEEVIFFPKLPEAAQLARETWAWQEPLSAAKIDEHGVPLADALARVRAVLPRDAVRPLGIWLSLGRPLGAASRSAQIAPRKTAPGRPGRVPRNPREGSRAALATAAARAT